MNAKVKAQYESFLRAEMRAVLVFAKARGIDTSTIEGRTEAVDAWIDEGWCDLYRREHEPPDSGWDFCSASPDSICGVDISDACHRHDLRYALQCPKDPADDHLKDDIRLKLRLGGLPGWIVKTVSRAYWGGVHYLSGIWSLWNRQRKWTGFTRGTR